MHTIRKEFWKRGGPVLAVLGIALAAASASGVVVKGKGELVAYGSGFAVVELRGVLRVRGLGLLIVEPDAHRATILWRAGWNATAQPLDAYRRVEITRGGA